MKFLNKLWWKIKNWYWVKYTLKDVVGAGCLPHKEDERDFTNLLGGFFDNPKPTKEHCQNANDWRYNQQRLNICVFASIVMAWSYQCNKRFSVKFAVKLAKKLGYIKGNGWSYLRAGLDLIVNRGALPYEDLPDEVQPWEEFSKYDLSQDVLNKATQYKSPGYYKVTSAEEAIKLLDLGYVLITAMNWYTGMNRPSAPDYYLVIWGSLVGGHAINVSGYRAPNLNLKDYENVQTFGEFYGEKGQVRIKNIFKLGFPVYVLEKINS